MQFELIIRIIRKFITFIQKGGEIMEILDKIILCLKQNHKTQKDLTAFLGIATSSMSDWKNGRNSSYLKYISQIAEYLNVSTDYLLGNEQKEKSLSEEDKLIADINNILSSKSKNELLYYKDLISRLAKDE